MPENVFETTFPIWERPKPCDLGNLCERKGESLLLICKDKEGKEYRFHVGCYLRLLSHALARKRSEQ